MGLRAGPERENRLSPSQTLTLLIYRKQKAHFLELLLLLPSSARVPTFRFTFSLVIVLLTDCCRKTVARPTNLAQVSQSRLGEMSRDSSKPYFARGRPGDPLIILSERVSRPGERGLA
ncbi:hypothetical protein DEO72_LG9g1734 [Vigna unguiculata]|uniref:Uncharacterized protein n=1 Tax=Vigna unguiculata TaxID=3917 RepID=A0A4D6MYV2_VIGUN|nr:hypothetical protein DEO72_LG9g1734 [Vigna unguiculata]